MQTKEDQFNIPFVTLLFVFKKINFVLVKFFFIQPYKTFKPLFKRLISLTELDS